MYIDLTGDNNIKLYVYDGRPLSRVRTGQSVTFDLSVAPMQIRSTLNGSVVDTRTDEACAALYQGMPVGVLFWGYDAVGKLSYLGGQVRITGTKIGMYDKGIPEFSIPGPRYQDFNEYADECYRLDGIFPFEDYLEHPPIEVNISDDLWHDPRDAERYFLIDPHFEYVPIPDSNRLPLIAIKDGDITVAEIPAQKRIYQDLKGIVGKPSGGVRVIRRNSYYEDSTYYYKVTFYYPYDVISCQPSGQYW